MPKLLLSSDIILAADVVYIEAVTKHFVKTLLNMLKLGKGCVLKMERVLINICLIEEKN